MDRSVDPIFVRIRCPVVGAVVSKIRHPRSNLKDHASVWLVIGRNHLWRCVADIGYHEQLEDGQGTSCTRKSFFWMYTRDLDGLSMILTCRSIHGARVSLKVRRVVSV